MGNPGLDPETALQLIQTLLYCLACILGGTGLLGLSTYIAFLCFELLSPQLGLKARLATVPQPVSRAPVVEENLDLLAETPTPAEAESLNGEAVPVPALPYDAQRSMTRVLVTLESEPTLAAVSAGNRPREVPARA